MVGSLEPMINAYSMHTEIDQSSASAVFLRFETRQGRHYEPAFTCYEGQEVRSSLRTSRSGNRQPKHGVLAM